MTHSVPPEQPKRDAIDHQRYLVRQRARLQRQIERRQQWSSRYSWARVLIFLGGLLLSAIVFFAANPWLSALLLLLSLVLFAGVLYQHERVNRSLARFQQMHHLKQAHVARIERAWDALPVTPPLELDYTHPFAADLDLIGPRSLLRLLDTAATVPGQERLTAWLTAPVPPPATTILARQQLVRELMARPLLRDRLTVQGQLLSGKPTNGEPADTATSSETHARWHPDRLLSWLQRHPTTANLRLWVWGLAFLALLNWGLLGANLLLGFAPFWRLSLGLYVLLLFWHGQTIGATFQAASAVQADLAQLLRVFLRLERYDDPTAPHLRKLIEPFHAAGDRPSHHLRRVARIAAATGVQGNPVVALVLNAVGPWGLYFAWQLGREKVALAAQLPTWLDRWAELEALSSLATYGSLNPAATFPTLHATDPAVAQPLFAATGLGHPLLAAVEKVRNDFHFDALGDVVILTGSNMAGKSTFLKTLALNLVLTYAGALVDARALTVPRLRLFTCIRVSDSVTDGISYFYAEVRRLKALLDALQRNDALPLFYAIDEIFRGTNNRERLEGSRAYIQALAAQPGVGLVATHDLELVQLATEVSTIANYHFRDEIVAGQMHFDYRLRPGPSPTTNALRLMQHAGLPVPLQDRDERGASDGTIAEAVGREALTED